MLLNSGVGEDSWESLDCKEIKSVNSKGKVLTIHWKDWYWSWRSNILATWCEELTHWKRHWCWEILKAGEEGDDRGWDGWMASPNRWTWVWASSGSRSWTGKPGVLQSMEMQRVGNHWVTELNWTELNPFISSSEILFFVKIFTVMPESLFSICFYFIFNLCHWFLKR